MTKIRIVSGRLSDVLWTFPVLINWKKPIKTGFSGFLDRSGQILRDSRMKPRLGFVGKPYQTGLNSQLCKSGRKRVGKGSKMTSSDKSEKEGLKSGVFSRKSGTNPLSSRPEFIKTNKSEK